MKVGDIMTQDVVALRADNTVEEIARLCNEHCISGMPVVDDDGYVIGMVSEDDLFLKERGIPFSVVRLPMLFKQWADPLRLVELYEGARHRTAAEVMTREVVCVNAEEPIGRVAWKMAQRKLKRVLVLRNGVLVGILTRSDIIQFLIGGGP